MAYRLLKNNEIPAKKGWIHLKDTHFRLFKILIVLLKKGFRRPILLAWLEKESS